MSIAPSLQHRQLHNSDNFTYESKLFRPLPHKLRSVQYIKDYPNGTQAQGMAKTKKHTQGIAVIENALAILKQANSERLPFCKNVTD